MSSSLFGTPDQVTFSEAKDSASLAYGDGSGTDLCGTRSYAITEGDSVTAVSS